MTCDENHKQWVEARVQALLEAADDTPLEKVRPCDMQKLVKSLKLRKACEIDGIPNECFRHLPRRQLVQLTHLFNHCLQLSHFPMSWKDTKIITLLNSGKDSKFKSNTPLVHHGQTFQKNNSKNDPKSHGDDRPA
jgi:hypothetical protein